MEASMQGYEVVIIGQGPAGLSAAIYTARAGLSTLLLGCDPKVFGDYQIDNYFGFPDSISGRELIERGQRQARRFGAELSCERVLKILPEEDGKFRIKTDRREIQGCSIILAPGVSRVRPNIEHLQEFEGKGVSYCVSCDGFFYRGKRVMVLGEGIFAANQALELLEYTPSVTICTQGKPLSMDQSFLTSIERSAIPIIEGKVVSLSGEQGLERVHLNDGRVMELDGLFLAMGEASSIDFSYSLGLLRKGIYIDADYEQRTNVAGVFAAGDCVGRFHQISVAVGEGAIAGKSAIAHVKGLCR
jgi:thioredoxin reductase (NADPH)